MPTLNSTFVVLNTVFSINKFSCWLYKTFPLNIFDTGFRTTVHRFMAKNYAFSVRFILFLFGTKNDMFWTTIIFFGPLFSNIISNTNWKRIYWNIYTYSWACSVLSALRKNGPKNELKLTKLHMAPKTFSLSLSS